MPKPMPWFRFYVEAIHDRKLRRLPPAQRWLWVAVLAAARQSPEPGRLLLADGVPVTESDLADMAAVPLKDVEAGLQAFVEQRMVERGEDGVIVVINWEKRQPATDHSTPRVKAYRRRRAEDETAMKRRKPVSETEMKRVSAVSETEMKRPGDVGETEMKRGETLPDTEIEREKREQHLQGDGDSLPSVENHHHAQGASGGSDASGEERVTNRDLIAELVASYRALPGIQPAKGDYSFVGRLYNDYGYDVVLEAINELAYRLEAGGKISNPLVYLKGICKRLSGESQPQLKVIPGGEAAAAQEKEPGDAWSRGWRPYYRKVTQEELDYYAGLTNVPPPHLRPRPPFDEEEETADGGGA